MKLLIRSLIIIVIISLLVFIFISLAGCTSMPENSGEFSEYEGSEDIYPLIALIQEEMSAKNITGLSISVADSEGLIWSDGFGLADKKAGTAFTDETISNIGSVSKLVTSAAIMRLVEMGKVDLDAPVSTYIPEFAPVGSDTFTSPITIRMLLNHESGLESDAYHDFFLGSEKPEDHPCTYRRAIEDTNMCGIVRDPYEIFSYCNLGYSLLGVIIERALGTDFQAAVDELIFTPLGMDDSSFDQTDSTQDRLATGYLNGKPQSIPFIRDMPAGSLNSTAEDMGKFLQSILASYTSGNGLLSKQTVDEVFTATNTDVAYDLDFRVGLTWWIVELQEFPDEFIVGHGGDLPPFHALLIMFPERDISVFAMVNSVGGVGSFSLTPIVTEAVRTFSKDELNQQKTEPSPIVEIPDSLKSELTGYYASPVGLSEVKTSGNKLKVFTFNKWFDAYYHEDHSLTLGYKLLGLIPISMPVFDELSISLEDLGEEKAINLRIQDILISPAMKVEPTPIDPAWNMRIGRYESVESEVLPHYTDFRIDMDKKSGFLCLYLKSSGEWSRFPLETLDASTARLMGTGRSLGSLIRVIDEDTLSYQNFILRRR